MPIASRSARWLRLLIASLCALAISAGEAGPLSGVMSSDGTAHAQSDPKSDDKGPASSKQARKFFRQGQRMFAMGRFRKALASYEKAYSLSKHPDILFNMAQCYRNLGDYESAVYHFRTYLEKKPDASNRKSVLELIEKLEAEIAKADRRKDPPPDDRIKPKPRPPKRTKPPKRKKDREASSPIYKRWWFWAGLVTVAGGAGVGIYYATSRDNGIPDTSLGNIDFPQ